MCVLVLCPWMSSLPLTAPMLIQGSFHLLFFCCCLVFVISSVDLFWTPAVLSSSPPTGISTLVFKSRLLIFYPNLPSLPEICVSGKESTTHSIIQLNPDSQSHLQPLRCLPPSSSFLLESLWMKIYCSLIPDFSVCYQSSPRKQMIFLKLNHVILSPIPYTQVLKGSTGHRLKYKP